MKKILGITLISAMLGLSLVACGTHNDVAETDEATDTAATQEVKNVDLSVVPEGCTFATVEAFDAGMALLKNTDPSAPPVTMEALEEAFGTEGVYYADCDKTENGMSYKNYAWFSEEDWGNSKVAVAVTFTAKEGSDDYSYYMYTAQGSF